MVCNRPHFLQDRLAQRLSLLTVMSAFAALGFQIYNGQRMDGLSSTNADDALRCIIRTMSFKMDCILLGPTER
jgi:hypothetical protein